MDNFLKSLWVGTYIRQRGEVLRCDVPVIVWVAENAEDDRLIKISMRTLSKSTNKSMAVVFRVINDLSRAGFLVYKGGKGRQKREYLLSIPDSENIKGWK